MIHLRRGHKAKTLKEEILKCLDSYGIELNQIYCATTDNGANIAKVDEILQEVQLEQTMEMNEITALLSDVLLVVRCPAHTIQLVASDVIKNLEPHIAICRKAIQIIRNLIRSGGTQTQMPVLDNAKCWYSVYETSSRKSLQNWKDWIDTEYFYLRDVKKK